MTTTPKQMTLPDEVQYALDRMCQPLDESVLWGATAREDKRCMQIIRDYIDAELAKQRKSSEASTLSDALRCLEDHALVGYTLQGDDVQRMLAVTDKLAGRQRNAAEATDEYGEPVTQIIDKLLSELSNAIEDVEAGKHKSSVLAFLNLAKEYGHAARDVICAIDAARQENKP